MRANHRALVALDAHPGSQIGTSAAMVRFSQRDVPVGQVPSTGNADTGSRSPLPAIKTDVTCRTKSGASSGTRGGLESRGGAVRHFDLVQMCKRVVDRGEIALHDFLPLFGIRLFNRFLDVDDRVRSGQDT